MADVPSSESDTANSGPEHSKTSAKGPGFAARWLKRIGITVAVLLVLGGGLLVLAEHRTSQPEFCGSCHIMDPYYESWHADLHGAKLDVACVDCHYAPGERTTIKAKFRGLSQVTSYFSGRYGSTRPRAHVDNRSCLTSKCHGDMAFMNKDISIGTVKFVHAHHLQLNGEKVEENAQKLKTLNDTLAKSYTEEQLAQLSAVAREAEPADGLIKEMERLASEWKIATPSEQFEELLQLHHRQVRIAQLADLQCTNCHSYADPESDLDGQGTKHHFTVKKTSCYTCHFNNQSFNSGTGTCLMCHSLPTGEILVHKELTGTDGTPTETPGAAKQAVSMDHRAILERKVNCIACHADVAMEDSQVTRRDCERCHDRPEFFKDWKLPTTIDLVKQYHKVHIPQQRAKCLDCHSEIHHQLVHDDQTDGAPGFLSSVMSNCTQCHASHHSQQIELLRGIGGNGVPHGDPNLMFGSRTNCFGCHIKEATDAHGGFVLKGALGGCIACHGDQYADTFEKWKQGLELVLMDAEDAYASAQDMLDTTENLSPDAREKAGNLLSAAQSDLQLVKVGNGVHNVTYSIELLDSVTTRCQQAMSIMSEAVEPKEN